MSEPIQPFSVSGNNDQNTDNMVYMNNDEMSDHDIIDQTEEERIESLLLLAEQSINDSNVITDELNENMIITLLHKLYKSIECNTVMREKYYDQPNKFMESELELNMIIDQLKSVATVPHYYYVLYNVQYKLMDCIINLLQHDNDDIKHNTIHMLNELVDTDILNEIDDSNMCHQFIQYIFHSEINILLISLLQRYQPMDTDWCIHNIDYGNNDIVTEILELYETVIEYDTALTQYINKNNLLYNYLYTIYTCNRVNIGTDTLSGTLVYTVELLSLVLINDTDTIHEYINSNGIKYNIKIIKQLCKYPTIQLNEQQYEYMTYVLTVSSNVLYRNTVAIKQFTELSGTEYILQLIKLRPKLQKYSLQIIDYLCYGNVDNCNRLIDNGILSIVFALLLKSTHNIDLLLSVVVQLFLHLTDTPYKRLLHKFVENNYEKIDYLIEQYTRYNNVLLVIHDQSYVTQLSNGLDIIQHICCILCLLATANNTQLTNTIQNKLIINRIEWNDIINRLRVYSDNLDDKVVLKTVIQNTIQLLNKH